MAENDSQDLDTEQEKELSAAAAADEAADQGDPDKGGDGAEQLGEAGKRAIDAMKRERNAARKELQTVQAKLKEHADSQKSEAERMQETATTSTTRAEKAESSLRAMQVAMDRAPDGATIAHVRAVAKRVRGDSDEDLESDADELFTLVVPKTTEVPARVPGRPTERLRGGMDPEPELEETDPAKLADLIGRN